MSRIDDLLEQMTLEEKFSMLAASDLWFSTPVPRLNIPFFHVADGPNGVRGVWSKMSPTSAATPVGIALGATWNPKIVEKIGNVRVANIDPGATRTAMRARSSRLGRTTSRRAGSTPARVRAGA